MLSYLVRSFVGELRGLFKTDDVYVLLHEGAEFVNIARRRLQEVDLDDESKVVEVMSKPVVIVKLLDVRYDEGRSGYRRLVTGMVQVSDAGRFYAVKAFTVNVGFEVRVYVLYAVQGIDLIPLFMSLNRSLRVNVSFGKYEIEVPVSLLVEEVWESVMEFILRGKGLKMYRVGGRVSCLTYVFPVNVKSGRGEVGDLVSVVGADVVTEGRLLLAPRLRFIDRDGNVVEETFECR